MSIVTIVVARAANGVIGRDGKLPWYLPDDLKRFKSLTMGTSMVMGRKTFESLGRLLPGRQHIVLTRDPDWVAEGADVAHDVPQALSLAREPHISVIGGAEVIALFEPLAAFVELTEVHGNVEGDTFLPPFDSSAWREVSREDRRGEEAIPAFSFVRLRRASGQSGSPL